MSNLAGVCIRTDRISAYRHSWSPLCCLSSTWRGTSMALSDDNAARAPLGACGQWQPRPAAQYRHQSCMPATWQTWLSQGYNHHAAPSFLLPRHPRRRGHQVPPPAQLPGALRLSPRPQRPGLTLMSVPRLKRRPAGRCRPGLMALWLDGALASACPGLVVPWLNWAMFCWHSGVTAGVRPVFRGLQGGARTTLRGGPARLPGHGRLSWCTYAAKSLTRT